MLGGGGGVLGTRLMLSLVLNLIGISLPAPTVQVSVTFQDPSDSRDAGGEGGSDPIS